jgi:hypothetical protein
VSIFSPCYWLFTFSIQAGEQSLDWLEGKSADAEEEQEEADKNQKLVVELSVKLTATLDKFSMALVTSHANNNASIDNGG